MTATPAVCQSPTILAALRIAPSAMVPPFTAHASQCPAFQRSTAEKRPQRHLRPPISKYHGHYSTPHRRRAPQTVHPASRPFPSSFLRYEHCRDPYTRVRPPHGVQLGTRHPTTRTNVPSAMKRLRSLQRLQREREGCVFWSQQVLRALALKELRNGLHHVGGYPDLKARELHYET